MGVPGSQRSGWRGLIPGAFLVGVALMGVGCEVGDEAAPPASRAASEDQGVNAVFKAEEASPPEAPAAMADPAEGESKAKRAYGIAGKGRSAAGGFGPGAISDRSDGAGDADVGLALGPIDPNGRFATTYRPGAGHLSAFESAVARGIIPVGEREVVADVGARYAPKFSAPSDRALGLRTDFERAELPPSGGMFHVRFSLQSTDAAPAERPRLAVHLVLDTSGSMRGEPIVRAREAAAAVVDKLAPTDVFSLTTFASNATVLVPQGAVGPRKPQIKQTISAIDVGGGTNIGGGLTNAYQEAQKPTVPKDVVNVVLLLSDGRANAGITDRSALSKLALDAFQEGVQTSSFGLGTDYDGELMSAIADDGAGGYYYLRDPEQITPALTTELDKRLDPVATAVELRVRLKPGVDLMKVYGSRRLSDAEASRVRAIEVAADAQAQKRDGIQADRQDDPKGGMRFFIPAFTRSDSHSVLLQLRVPAGVGDKPLAQVELKYKDRVAKKNVVDEWPVKIKFANSDAASAKSRDLSVARTVQGFAAGETLARAAVLIARQDRGQAAGLLREREGILRQAADSLEEPLFLRDADRLARLRSYAEGGMDGMGDPLVLAMMMETAARVHMH
jgi:Ca-activated chloride channel family protein